MAPAQWPDWSKMEDLVKREDFASGGSLFQEMRKKIIQSGSEANDVAAHAPIAWEFLIGLACKKRALRRQILGTIQRLTELPAWMTAWEASTRLHAKVKDLDDDLQAALAVQHKAIAESVSPSALKSMTGVKQEERPELLWQETTKEKLVDEIREKQQEDHGAPFNDEPETPLDESRCAVSTLHAGIDAAVAIDSDEKMDEGGLSALSELRIGCIQCAGDESVFSREVSQAPLVFNFLLHLLRRKQGEVAAVAEVMNQLMASPSWASVFEGSTPLQDGLRDLPEETQASLGLQHETIMKLISTASRTKAEKGDLAESVKDIAPLMQSIRRVPVVQPAEIPSDGPDQAVTPSSSSGYVASSPVQAAPQHAASAAPVVEWRSARTPQGHTYYFNTSTKESQWERPEALGGPVVYTVGVAVEVWSNSQNCWGRGKVEKVDDATGIVSCEFSLPNQHTAKKDLPRGHKDLRLVDDSAPTEGFSSDESSLYRKLFEGLPEISEQRKSSKVVAEFLLKSGAKTQALRQVWAVANPGLKKQLDFDDFARCCRLIAHCQDMGLNSDLVAGGERPLRVALRSKCLFLRPPRLPTFGA